MQWARYILEFLDILAWPAIVAVIATLFRREIRGVLDRLARISFPGGPDILLAPASEDLIRYIRKEKVEELRASEEDAKRKVDPSEQHDIPAAKDLATIAMRANDLVFKQLELELGRSVQREVSYKQRPDMFFDGVFAFDSGFTFVEVKYLNRPRSIEALAKMAFVKFERMLKEAGGRGIDGILVFVANGDADEIGAIEVEARRLEKKLARWQQIRVYSYGSLEANLGSA